MNAIVTDAEVLERQAQPGWLLALPTRRRHCRHRHHGTEQEGTQGQEHPRHRPHTIDRRNPSDELPLLGIWFGSLEEEGAKVIKEIREKDPVSPRTLILSRRTTHSRFTEHLTETVLNTAMLSRMFPDKI